MDRLAFSVAGRPPRCEKISKAAETLGECVKTARSGHPEKLNKHDQRRLSEVLEAFGCDARSHVPRSKNAAAAKKAAKKRRQRQRELIAPIVVAERARLDAEVAAGRMVKVSACTYVNSDDE